MDTNIKIWKLEPMDYYQDRTDIEKRILELILKNKYITKKIALENGISEHIFRKYINVLLNDGILIKEGKSKNIGYRLNNTEEAFIYQRKKEIINSLANELNKK